MTGAEYIREFLLLHGVDTVFGYPGAALLEIYDAIGDSTRHILMRHEQGAVHAAVGYSKASGKTGVCIATSGAGATNLVTGIADAYLDSAPLIVITGQVDTSLIGRDAFQEADITGITMPVVKHSYLVRTPDRLAASLGEAWNIAAGGRPGPVLIDIAHDILTAELPAADYTLRLPRSRGNRHTISDCIGGIAEILSRSRRPVILSGGGVVSDRASSPLSRFARLSGIPVTTTLPGMGMVLDESERNGVNILGMAGIYGTEAANLALRGCDAIIAVGTRLSERTLPSGIGEAGLIHCDIDPAEINKNYRAQVNVLSPAGEFFEALCEADIGYLREEIAEWSRGLSEYKKKPLLRLSDKLGGSEILRALNAARGVRHDIIYVTDVGEHQMTAARELEPAVERGFVTSAGLGAMGFGLPAAIGAAFAAPADVSRVVLVCGDGGFQMTMEELAAVHRAPLPIKIFILDNSALGMIKQMQAHRFAARFTDSELPDNPDFGLIAAAYSLGYRCIDISDRDMLEPICAEILESEESLVVRCVIA